MSPVNPYVNQYRKNEVETANPGKILLLLYDGAIQFLNKAKLGIEEGDTSQVTPNIYSCQKIILEFMNTLDMDNGGSLAENLYNLYDYFYRTLVDASFNHDLKKIGEVLRHLKSLRETWQQAIAIANAEKDTTLIDKYEKSAEEGQDGEFGYIDDEEEDEDEDDDEDEDEEA